MPIYIRPRSKGNAFELRVTHKCLDKPRYATLDTREAAEALGNRTLATLERGETPPWLVEHAHPETRTIRDLVREFLGINKVAASTRDVLDTIVDQVGNVDLTEVAVPWAEGWILSLKKERQLTPGTIRKRKGALSRVFHWAEDHRPLCLARNPLGRLPHGYSGYTEDDVAALVAQGIDLPEDCERDRRIDPAEEQRIVVVLQQRLLSAQTLQQRAEAEGLQLMFELALQTAMRMRETYTLTLDQIQLERETIFLERSKNGDRRQVPLNAQACAILNRRWPALEEIRQGGNRLLPWWDGQLTKDTLKRTTAEVSRRFADLFEQADCEDLHFHDARHESVCRWVLLTPITSEQLGRWAGMRDARTRMRYLSLRGSEGAKVLNQRRDGGAVSQTPTAQEQHGIQTTADR